MFTYFYDVCSDVYSAITARQHFNLVFSQAIMVGGQILYIAYISNIYVQNTYLNKVRKKVQKCVA